MPKITAYALKPAKYALKAIKFARSPKGKRDIALVVATSEAIYQAAKQAGVL